MKVFLNNKQIKHQQKMIIQIEQMDIIIVQVRLKIFVVMYCMNTILESSSTNSTQQPSSSPSNPSPTVSGMWVVGLQFRNVNKVQLDLTEEIRTFLSVVYKASANSNMNRENLNLDAR